MIYELQSDGVSLVPKGGQWWVVDLEGGPVMGRWFIRGISDIYGSKGDDRRVSSSKGGTIDNLLIQSGDQWHL